MDALYDRNIQCLVCKKYYTSKKIRSRFVRAVKHDTDFCSYYKTEENNPLLYYVHVCPHCGFSASEEFTTYFPPLTLEQIEEKICSQWSGMNYCGIRTIHDAINTYKLAIYSATLKKERHIAVAGLHMRLAWLYRTIGNQEEELRFMRLACKKYMESYITEDFRETHLSEIRLLYIIGELNRRIGNEKQAVMYFSNVIQKQNETIEKRIVEMAKDRWFEIREQRKMETIRKSAT
jgi:uncharacterized protein